MSQWYWCTWKDVVVSQSYTRVPLCCHITMETRQNVAWCSKRHRAADVFPLLPLGILKASGQWKMGWGHGTYTNTGITTTIQSIVKKDRSLWTKFRSELPLPGQERSHQMRADSRWNWVYTEQTWGGNFGERGRRTASHSLDAAGSRPFCNILRKMNHVHKTLTCLSCRH